MILNNANLVTFSPSEPIVEGALVAVEGKTIVDFGKVGKLIDKYDDPEVLDVSGRLTLPGFVDAHDRLYLRFATGMPAGGLQRKTPLELRRLRHRLEAALDESALYWSAIAGLLDAIRSGVTTVLALNSSPAHVEGSLEVLARAFRDVGARGSIAYALSPRSSAKAALAETVRHIEASRGAELVRGLVGAEATAGLVDDVLSEAAGSGAPVQVVLDDDASELDECFSRHGTTPLGRLHRAGLLRGGGVVVRRGELLQEDEPLLRDTGVFLAHAPQSGAVSAEASPDLLKAASAGISLALGTGGTGGSLLEELRIAALGQRARGCDLADAIRLGYRAAFMGNAALATGIFGAPLGVVKPGARADLVVLDYWPTTPMAAETLPEHLFWGAARARVHSVIVNGAVVYHNGRFSKLDEERLRARARESARATWERI